MSVKSGASSKLRVVVVGAGIVGASIAFHLSRRDAEVTVVDQGRPGAGASSHSFAYLNSFGKEPAFYHDLNSRSLDLWDRFARRLNADIGLRWGGQLKWVETGEAADQLRAQVVGRQRRGYAARMIEDAEMRHLEPELDPGHVAAAAISENDGHVDPPRVVQACLKHARAGGATVHLETQAKLLLTGDAGGRRSVRAVLTDGGEIECDVVVLAAGIGTTGLAKSVGMHVPQMESPGVVVKTEPVRQLLETVSVIYAPPVNAQRAEIHMRQYLDGAFMIGEGSQESLARNDSQDHADDLLARAAHYLPALRGSRAIAVPTGYRPMPVDGLPVLGFTDEVPNVYIALMHSGVTLAPLVGELSVIEIMDGVRVEMLDAYRIERFKGQGLETRLTSGV